ncbi:hypothetical protein [Flavobacterium humidisoli]|uniref:Uncharacterized protein n=1 Tax=Flavobacterium humidisoli TaxID=2937442 RepID=A0ABY4LXK9_9FLAO|nr:hypothetical protein [Flavobacterium humidisoli]UPZ17809.1 hypothetical protein M0M44_10765 [Flavobacterium humidisoli]
MIEKKYNPELVDFQEDLRNNLLLVSTEFEISETEICLEREKKIITLIEALQRITKDSLEEEYFKNYKYFISVLFHIIKWANKEFTGKAGGDANLKAAKLHANQINLSKFNYPESFIENIKDWLTSVASLADVNDAKTVLAEFSTIIFPMLFTQDYDAYARFRGNQQPEYGSKEEIILVSIEFSIDSEPWANPQILKPQEIYGIKGKIRVNEWPKGYSQLFLMPVSAQNNSLFELILPPIDKTADPEIEVRGQIVFKYPQHSFDESMAVKLLAYFQGSNERLFPTIIGYDQLIAKVLDPNAVHFLTGFKGMNKAVFDVLETIQNEAGTIDKEELYDFSLLLSSILNYQGFSLQQGIYKNIDNISEDIFRDNMIQHLIGMHYIGENLNKEAHLAGGRVEIGYKGIIAELKVEKVISDRDKIIAKYSKQPVAYASGNAKQLSILCVLDLTKKILPPAAPQNNVMVVTPDVHGFQNGRISYPSKQVVVIFDGNTVKPSDYSK